MKARISLVIALLVGVVAGAAGVWALCNEGYCGDDSTETPRQSAVSTATGFGAGQNWGAPTSTAPATVTPSPTTGTSPEITEITGLAIISDSTADEYRADNPRGGEFGDTTFNWVELLARERSVNLGAWGDDRPEPRRGGYEFNWARSGATSETMISNGQHTGVAQQIQAGQVSHVIIQIGINDFYEDNVALAIYGGQLSGEPLQQFLDGVIDNVELAVQTVKVAGKSKVMLAATPDYLSPEVLPGLQETFPDAAGRQRVIDAFAYVNQGLAEVATREQVHFFDFNAALRAEIVPRRDPNDQRFILVGAERIDVNAKGNDPHYMYVDDDYAHAGTVFSGLFANLFINEMNAVFGTGLAPFSDDEILSIAGMK